MRRLSKEELEERLQKYFSHGHSKDAVFVPLLIQEFVQLTTEAMHNRQDTVTVPIELCAALACYLETE
jgi:hypothetical protein